MLSRALLTVSVLFAAVAFAVANPAPYKLGMMSANNVFGLEKRQAGYQPSTSYCGSGDTCAIACGPGSETCPASDSDAYCFTPANQTCCPNLSGQACDFGFYCTQDSADETWCCPNGMDLMACAAQYTVSALVSLSGSATIAAASTTASMAPPTTTAPPPAPPTTSETAVAAASTTTDITPATTTTSTTPVPAIPPPSSSAPTVTLIIPTVPSPSSSAPIATLLGTTSLGHASSTASTTGIAFAAAANRHAGHELGVAVALGVAGLVVVL